MKITSADKSTIETYYVLKSDEDIRHGHYELKKNKKLHTSGEYFQGKPSGNWIIGNENHNLSFNGSFLEDQRHGKWTYLLKGESKSEIYYTNGRADSVISRNMNGTPIAYLTLDKDGNGKSLTYFDNGQVRSNITIKNYIIHGECNLYYENGQLLTRMDYLDDRPINIYETYQSDGTIIESEPFQNGTGKYIHYSVSDNEELSMNEIAHYKDTVLHGSFELYNEEGIKISYGNYNYGNKTGIWVHGNDTNSYNSPDPPKKFELNKNPKKDKLYYEISSGFTNVEIMPEFPGGQTKLMAFLGESIKYPKEAKDMGKQGRVYVTFVIDEMGFVTQPKILRGVYPELDAEAMRVVRSLPRWSPGMSYGLPLKVQYNLPFNFSLK